MPDIGDIVTGQGPRSTRRGGGRRGRRGRRGGAEGVGAVAIISRMRQVYAHEAVVLLAPDGDERALGGAVTVALCGGWSHDPPCPLAPHHTRADRTGDEVRLRVLFVTEPEQEARVRERI